MLSALSSPQTLSQESELKKFTLTSEQIRAARMLLRWEQKDLAIRSGISLSRIKYLETQPGELGSHQTTIKAFRKAFENAGIRFIGGYFRGAVLRENRGEPDARKSTPAVSAPASKPVKPIKKVAKKARSPHPKG
jgi:hypothetical protein